MRYEVDIYCRYNKSLLQLFERERENKKSYVWQDRSPNFYQHYEPIQISTPQYYLGWDSEDNLCSSLGCIPISTNLKQPSCYITDLMVKPEIRKQGESWRFIKDNFSSIINLLGDGLFYAVESFPGALNGLSGMANNEKYFLRRIGTRQLREFYLEIGNNNFESGGSKTKGSVNRESITLEDFFSQADKKQIENILMDTDLCQPMTPHLDVGLLQKIEKNAALFRVVPVEGEKKLQGFFSLVDFSSTRRLIWQGKPTLLLRNRDDLQRGKELRYLIVEYFGRPIAFSPELTSRILNEATHLGYHVVGTGADLIWKNIPGVTCIHHSLNIFTMYNNKARQIWEPLFFDNGKKLVVKLNSIFL